jgi:hypothetical protein
MPLIWTWLSPRRRPGPRSISASRGTRLAAPDVAALRLRWRPVRRQGPAVEFWGPYGNPQVLHLSQNMAQVYFGALPLLLLLAPA